MSFWQKLFEKNKEENITSPVRSPNFDEARFKVKNLGEQALEKVTELGTKQVAEQVAEQATEQVAEQNLTLLNSETQKKDVPKFVGSSRVNDNQDFDEKRKIEVQARKNLQKTQLRLELQTAIQEADREKAKDKIFPHLAEMMDDASKNVVKQKRVTTHAHAFLTLPLWLRELFICVCIVFIMAFVFIGINNNFGYISIYANNMSPSLKEGDKLILKYRPYGLPSYKRGDIVLLQDTAFLQKLPKAKLVQRIIGVPGDNINFIENKVYINGQELKETYLEASTKTELMSLKYQSLHLGENEYFVMHDKRQLQDDSRQFGPVKISDIEGKLIFSLSPFGQIE